MQKIDKYFSIQKGTIEYPSIILVKTSRAVVKVAMILPQGGLQMLASPNDDNVLRSLPKKVEHCPVSLGRLLKVTPIVYRKAENEDYLINTVQELLEVVDTWELKE